MGALARAAQALARLARSPAARQRLVQAAQKAREAFAQATRKAVQGCKAWQRNRAIRQAYNARKRALKQEIDAMRKAGRSRREIAERAHQFRRSERLSAREQMKRNGDGDLVAKLEKRDLKKYGNKDGPDFEQSVGRARTNLKERLKREPSTDEVYDEIAESANRTDVWTNMKFLTF
jgi:hypothetical protein